MTELAGDSNVSNMTLTCSWESPKTPDLSRGPAPFPILRNTHSFLLMNYGLRSSQRPLLMTNPPSSMHTRTDLLPPSLVSCETASLGESRERRSTGGHSSSLTAGNESKQSRPRILFTKTSLCCDQKVCNCVCEAVSVSPQRRRSNRSNTSDRIIQ